VAIAGVKIGLPEASLGLIPGWKGISRLTRLAGESVAKRLVFGAELIDAEAACPMGIIDETAPDEAALDAKIDAMIKQFRRGSPNAVAMTKSALRSGDEIKAFADCFAHGDATEGMSAFIEKRPASWMEG
jgi:enoyl-CoA hydratase